MHGLTFIGYIVVPVFLVYHRWVGHVPEPGYAHARDALLLRRPAPPVMADPTQGLFVPPASPPGHDETVDVRSFVRKLPAIIGLGVLLVIGFFLLTKLIFGFGPFF